MLLSFIQMRVPKTSVAFQRAQQAQAAAVLHWKLAMLTLKVKDLSEVLTKALISFFQIRGIWVPF